MRQNVYVWLVTLFTLSMLTGTVSAALTVQDINDFYTDKGEHHSTDATGGALHLKKIAHFYIESTLNKPIVAVAYDYSTDRGYYLTKDGYLYSMSGHTTTLVKALPPTATALAVKNGRFAVITVSHENVKSTLWIYDGANWIYQDYSGVLFNSVTMNDNVVLAVGVGDDYNAGYYNFTTGVFGKVNIYTYKVTGKYDGSSLILSKEQILAITTVSPITGWYVSQRFVEKTYTYDIQPNLYQIKYVPNLFLLLSENQILLINPGDLVNGTKNLKANIYYQTPTLPNDISLWHMDYYPQDGVLIVTGRITLKFDVKTGAHFELFNSYLGDDKTIASGAPTKGEYLYFVHDEAAYYRDNMTISKEDVVTTDGKNIIITKVDNLLTVKNIWAGHDDSGNWYIGFYDIRNFEPNGYYISDAVDVKQPEQDKAMISAVNMTWYSDVPNGTSLSVYVSNDGGASWYNITEYNGKEFNNWTTSYYDNVFRYKIIMTSPEQLYSPVVNSIRYSLKVLYPAAVSIDPIPPTYTLVPVNFTARATGDLDGNIVWFNWTFGEPTVQMLDGERAYYNGSFGSGDGFSHDLAVSHIYARPGTYTVNLTVMDSDGQISTASTEVIILNRLPVPVYNISVISGTGNALGDSVSVKTGSEINFNANASYDPDGVVTDGKWYIAGDEYSGLNITYTASTSLTHAAVYNAYVRVWDADGGVNDSETITVYVSPDDLYPIAYFTIPAQVQVGDTLILDGSSSWDDNGISNYTWAVNGKEYYGVSVTYTVQDAGYIHIALKVTDSKGQSDWYNRTVLATYWPATGDWIISSHITVKNATSTAFHGNIIIEPGGWLEAYDLTIIFGCRYDGQYRIEVQDGGKLTAENSLFDTLYFYDPGLDMQHYQRFMFNFLTSGQTYLNSTKVYSLNADKSSYIEGITVGAGILYMKNSIIERSEGSASIPSTVTETTNIKLYDTGIYHISSAPILIGSTYGDLVMENVTIKSVESYVSNQGTASIKASYMQYARNSGIYNSGTLTIEDSVIKHSSTAIRAYGTTYANGLTIVGKGDNSKGIEAAYDLDITNSSISYAWIGVYTSGHTVDIINCQFSMNTDPYIAESGGRINIKNYITILVRYFSSPVKGADIDVYSDGILLYSVKTDASGTASNLILPYATTTSTAYDQHYYTVTASVFNKNPAILDTNRTINTSNTHTEIWQYGSPEQSQGATSMTSEFGDIWAWVAIALTWIILLVGWFTRILRMPLWSVILLGLIITAAIAYFMLFSLFYIILLAMAWFSVLLMWVFHVFAPKVKMTITGVLGAITAAFAWWNGNASLGAIDIADIGNINVNQIVAVAVPLAIVGGVIYGYMKGKLTKQLALAGGFGAFLLYLVLSGMYWQAYFAVLGVVIGYVAWYMITHNTNLSLGAAVLIIALIGIGGLIGAYVLGLWYPGMIMQQTATETAKQLNPTNGWNISNPFEGVIP